MAFLLANFSQISGSANNTVSTLQSGAIVGAPAVNTYISLDDSMATVSADGYFNQLSAILNLGDLIYAVCMDGPINLTVVQVQVFPAIVKTAFGVVTGDVSGPASSLQYQPTIFADTSGKVIEGEVWLGINSSPVTVVPYGLYVANLGTLLTFNMPAIVPFGARLSIVGLGAGGWLLQMNTGQTAHLGSSATSSAGSLASTNRYDVIHLLCTTANTTFSVIGSMGNITYA